MTLRRQSKSSKAVLIKQCDDIFRELLRKRDKVCQYSNKPDNLQVCHFISRENKHLRWNFDNCCMINAGIHKFVFHKKPHIHREFMVKRIGEEKVHKFELMDKVTCRPLYECEIKIIKSQLLKELEG